MTNDGNGPLPHPLLEPIAVPDVAGDPALTNAVAPFLAAEARLLDQREFSAWAELFTDDGLLVVPLRPGGHPARELALTVDDAGRRTDRLAWLDGPATWSQRPRPRTCRVVGTIEAWQVDGGDVIARSAVTIAVERRSGVSAVTGVQVHLLVAAAPWAIRVKWLTPIGAGFGFDDPSVIL